MKDEHGHGSNGRGGSFQNIDRNARGPGKHIGYANGAWNVQKSNGPKSDWYSAVHQRTGDVISGKGLREISAKLASRVSSGNATPQEAASAMHSNHVVGGGHDSTYHGLHTHAEYAAEGIGDLVHRKG